MLRTAFVALTLALTPLSALAFGCMDEQRAAVSCEQGTQWNADQQKCVPIVTG